MKKTTLAILVLALAVGASACGGGTTTSYTGGEVVGTYVLDLEKTLGAQSSKAGDATEVALRERLAVAFDEAHYSLVLEPDRTYRLTIGEGDGALDVIGDWAPNLGGLGLTAREAGGEPVPPEDRVTETVAQDGPWLVLTDDGTPFYLKRL